MMHSIKDSLEKAGFAVMLGGPKIKEEDLIKAEPDILLVFSGEYLNEHRASLVAVSEYSHLNGRILNVIGYEDEIGIALRTLKPDFINKIYKRPLIIEDLIADLGNQMKEDEESDDLRHILVVDDSGPMLRSIKQWLKDSYKVSVASSAAMAISFLSTQKPDLILLDYEMPICDGPQFLEMIRSEDGTKNIPVIFLTGKNDIESVKTVLSMKPDGYLLKTLQPFEILNSINDFFEKLQ